MAVARWLQRPFVRGAQLRLPLPKALRWRTAPALAPRPARAALLGRDLPPDEEGPLAGSGARGLTVAYFIQCVTDHFAPEQAAAAIRVLRACGARIVVPGGQHCCGLPALDVGDRATARGMARQTITALEAVRADWIVTAAASCAIALMHDYGELLRDEPRWRERAETLAARTLDLVSFLERVAKLPVGALRWPPGPGRLTYHSFCQSTNVLGIAGCAPRLLREVCGLEVRELPESEVCCGFGGSTSMDHAEVARAIVTRKLDNVTQTEAPSWSPTTRAACCTCAVPPTHEAYASGWPTWPRSWRKDSDRTVTTVSEPDRSCLITANGDGARRAGPRGEGSRRRLHGRWRRRQGFAGAVRHRRPRLTGCISECLGYHPSWPRGRGRS
jgi:hypothetical protein